MAHEGVYRVVGDKRVNNRGNAFEREKIVICIQGLAARTLNIKRAVGLCIVMRGPLGWEIRFGWKHKRTTGAIIYRKGSGLRQDYHHRLPRDGEDVKSP